MLSYLKFAKTGISIIVLPLGKMIFKKIRRKFIEKTNKDSSSDVENLYK